MRIVPLSRCSKMLLSRMDDFGFGTDEISFHSALFLKNVRTPKAAPQYKLREGSLPFPNAGGTGMMPWCSLSARATKTWTTRGLVCAEAEVDARRKKQAARTCCKARITVATDCSSARSAQGTVESASRCSFGRLQAH